MLLILGTPKQMAVLNLNDVVHIPSGLCFLTMPLLFLSTVINLSWSDITRVCRGNTVQDVRKDCSSFDVCVCESLLSALKKTFPDGFCVIFYSIHSWRKLIKMKTVEKPKCRLKQPTPNSLITLGQLWFSISKIQWKVMNPHPPQTNSTFFLNHLGCNEAPII